MLLLQKGHRPRTCVSSINENGAERQNRAMLMLVRINMKIQCADPVLLSSYSMTRQLEASMPRLPQPSQVETCPGRSRDPTASPALGDEWQVDSEYLRW